MTGGSEPSMLLAQLAKEVAACTACAELASTRTQTVFGDGNPKARLVFMGEAPGADEDRQGVPFVGRAGKLLTDIITKGMRGCAAKTCTSSIRSSAALRAIGTPCRTRRPRAALSSTVSWN